MTDVPNKIWKDYEYDSFMLREKEFGKKEGSTDTSLIEGLATTKFPDGSIPASALSSGSLVGEYRMDRAASIVITESDTSLGVANGTTALAIPAMLDKSFLTAALATVHTIGSSGTTTIQIRRRRSGSDVDMLSTRITVSYNEYYAADGVIDPLYKDVSEGDQLYIDVDTVATGAKGLSIVLTFF